MKNDYYMHQQFLLNVDFRNVCLEDYTIQKAPLPLFNCEEQKNLFDFDFIERGVYLSFILKEFDKENQWDWFIYNHKWIDKFIILVDVHINDGNKITRIFLECTTKALVKRLLDYGKEVALLYL